MSRLIQVVEACARNSKQTLGSANGGRHEAMFVVHHTIPLISHAKIERQVRTNLPIVFEESTELIRVPVAPTLRHLQGSQEPRVRRIFYVKCLSDACDRAGQVDQEVASGGLVIAKKAGKSRLIDSGHRVLAGAEGHGRWIVGNESRIGDVTKLTAKFECVQTLCDAERIGIRPQGGRVAAAGARTD